MNPVEQEVRSWYTVVCILFIPGFLLVYQTGRGRGLMVWGGKGGALSGSEALRRSATLTTVANMWLKWWTTVNTRFEFKSALYR